MKKGILIDVHNRTITEVEVTKDSNDSELQSMYNHIKCGMVECVSLNDENDVWVDEEGLLNFAKILKMLILFKKIPAFLQFFSLGGWIRI